MNASVEILMENMVQVMVVTWHVWEILPKCVVDLMPTQYKKLYAVIYNYN